ncbi:DUF4148 domain-containing protein [Burkholderia cepacia]|uniref:DUF4148 domain-containing protein n=1 Tax=Burkholderia cepacia TaxID=292 RepID=UPI002AB749FB|nr:DUF4148 domain-containing protein [Burkholderia cepacia]
MKRFTQGIAVAALGIALPVASFAQQAAQSVTRAQLREELRLLEQAGYSPVGPDISYPNDLRAAQERIRKSQEPTPHKGASGSS